MTWFKVDDKFHSHAKVARLGDDSDALALWVVAGSWCADQLTDGWVPAYVARKLDPDSARRAAALVRVGLWEEAEREDEKGWVFHGWNEPGRQPTAEQVQQDRETKSARQQRWRERMRKQREARDVGGGVDASTSASVDIYTDSDFSGDGAESPHGAEFEVDEVDEVTSWGRGVASTSAPTSGDEVSGTAGQSAESRRNVDASTRRAGDGGVDGAPTRPDPTKVTTKNLSPSADADGALFGADAASAAKPKRPDPMKRFPEFWAIYPRKVGKTAAEKNWAKAILGGADPQAIIDGARLYAIEMRGKDKDVIKYPQGWLTDGRWMDEHALTPPPDLGASDAGSRPPWCGLCNERTRMTEDDENPEHCPRCHPRTQKETTP